MSYPAAPNSGYPAQQPYLYPQFAGGAQWYIPQQTAQQGQQQPTSAPAIDPSLSTAQQQQQRAQAGSSSATNTNTGAQQSAAPVPPSTGGQPASQVPAKRGPGRPKGSRTKKRHIDFGPTGPLSGTPIAPAPSMSATAAAVAATPAAVLPASSAAPVPAPYMPAATAYYPIWWGDPSQYANYAMQALPAPVKRPSTAKAGNANTPPATFAEFQVRVMNMCLGFYDAANDLISSTPPHLMSQAFTPAGTSTMQCLNDIRKACDTLVSIHSSAAPTTSAAGSSPYVAQPPAAASKSPASKPASYTGYKPSKRPPATGTSESPAPAAPTRPPTNPPPPHVTYGAWTDAELTKIRTLVAQWREQYGQNPNQEPNWDWITHQWGPGRTRHQIVLRAGQLGLKSTTTHPPRIAPTLTPAKPAAPAAPSEPQASSATPSGVPEAPPASAPAAAQANVEQNVEQAHDDDEGDGDQDAEADEDGDGEHEEVENEVQADEEADEEVDEEDEEPAPQPAQPAQPTPQPALNRAIASNKRVGPALQQQLANGNGKGREIQPMTAAVQASMATTTPPNPTLNPYQQWQYPMQRRS